MAESSRPQLTPTQWRVLERVAAGESTSTIAAALGMAPKTVKNHLTRLAQELPRDPALTKRAAAVAWYLTVGRALREQEANGDDQAFHHTYLAPRVDVVPADRAGARSGGA